MIGLALPVDGRSVGELLLDADLTARASLWDPNPAGAKARVRSWGEVAEAAAELWASIPDETADPSMGRITIVDLETLRYRHVLLVTATTDAFGRPEVQPLRVHAGGLVWFGPYLHVAGTKRGLYTCHLDDLMHVESDGETFGYRYVLPVRTDAGPVLEGIVHGSSASGATSTASSRSPLPASEHIRSKASTRTSRGARAAP